MDEQDLAGRDKYRKNMQVLKYWKPSSRITKHDLENNRKSLLRKYENRLYFIVKNVNTGLWEFPTAERCDPDTMRVVVIIIRLYHCSSNLIV